MYTKIATVSLPRPDFARVGFFWKLVSLALLALGLVAVAGVHLVAASARYAARPRKPIYVAPRYAASKSRA